MVQYVKKKTLLPKNNIYRKRAPAATKKHGQIDHF